MWCGEGNACAGKWFLLVWRCEMQSINVNGVYFIQSTWRLCELISFDGIRMDGKVWNSMKKNMETDIRRMRWALFFLVCRKQSFIGSSGWKFAIIYVDKLSTLKALCSPYSTFIDISSTKCVRLRIRIRFIKYNYSAIKSPCRFDKETTRKK